MSFERRGSVRVENLFGLRRSNGGDHRFEITDTQRLIDGALRLVYQARVS